MESDSLLRKTLAHVAIMVGATTLFVGTLSVVAAVVTSHAVGGDASESASESAPAVPGKPGTPGKGREPARPPPSDAKTEKGV